MGWTVQPPVACRGRDFSRHQKMSSSAMGHTQTPTERAPEDLSVEYGRKGVKVITPLHLVPRLRISGAIPLLLLLLLVCIFLSRNVSVIYNFKVSAQRNTVISDLPIIFRTQCIGTFITYVHIKFHIPGFTQLNIKILCLYIYLTYPACKSYLF